MLRIIVPGTELFDQETSTFTTIGDRLIELEHSLLSLSKWESKFQKPFLSSTAKTTEEVFEYIKFMILTDPIPDEVFTNLTETNLEAIQEYIESKQSATTFREMKQSRGRSETITSELIYYWMVTYQIPFECEAWHLNRLFSLIRICGIKNSKPKKMSQTELREYNRKLNSERRSALGSSG